MTKGRISVESVAAIANAIREKLGTTATYISIHAPRVRCDVEDIKEET